ncbi:MAG: cytochrome P450 [Bacillaceae bacterium]|nr:cytochrome P450 [Bacillaceae bacterium]
MQTVKIPGPKGFPITGNLFRFRNEPLAFLTESAHKYGDMVRIRLGPTRHVYLINHPDYIKEVLVDKKDAFRKSLGLQIAKKFLGEGLLTSEGKEHMRQRRLMQPAFKPDRISQYADTMAEYGEKLADSWQDGEQRNITRDMMDVTLRIIVRTMFSIDMKQDPHDIGKALEVGLKYIIDKTRTLIDIPDRIPTRRNRQFKRAGQTLNQAIYTILEERRQNGPQDNGDLLSMLMNARDEKSGTGLTDELIRDQVMTIFLAGHETTANTLSWTWYLLSQHPEVEQKFHVELDRVLGNRLPTADDVSRLTYTRQVIQESMRLYPAAWIIGREALREVEIGGHSFDKGDTLLMSQYVMHRNPKYYEQPDRFMPERFAGDLLEKNPPFAYFPFGGGPRVCIGNHFALLESTLLLAVIGQKFKLRLIDNHHPVEPEPLITLRPKNGLYMKVLKR